MSVVLPVELLLLPLLLLLLLRMLRISGFGRRCGVNGVADGESWTIWLAVGGPGYAMLHEFVTDTVGEVVE